MDQTYRIEFNRYRTIVEKAVVQVSDEAFFRVPYPDGNSIAMLLNHLSGNLKSRFTDFQDSDGEKPWRHRDREFEAVDLSRDAMMEKWNEAWGILDEALDSVGSDDYDNDVTIRGISLTIREALNRSLAHIAYHAGQVVLLARMSVEDWQWITVPKGGSEAYNRNPDMEKSIGG